LEWRISHGGWFVPTATLIAGLVVGNSSAATFVARHSGWTQLP